MKTEAVYVGQNAILSEYGTLIRHKSVYVTDANVPGYDIPEPLHFRIRVGEPGCGFMKDLTLYDCLHFTFTAEGGDYLEYFGDTELHHYDVNFNLKEAIRGEGCPVALGNIGAILWGYLQYTTDSDPHAQYLLTEIRKKQVYRIYRK